MPTPYFGQSERAGDREYKVTDAETEEWKTDCFLLLRKEFPFHGRESRDRTVA